MPFLTATPVSAGDRFGRLIIVREIDSAKTPNGTICRRVECKCDCGSIKVFRLPALRSGKTKSCGCLSIDGKRQRMQKHGGTGTPEYQAWIAMRARCNDVSNRNYGGRGIAVCDRWDKSFEAFLADMGPRPSPEHSIDRHPNTNGNYEPGNCRWATATEQARNTRVNVLVEHDGETRCIAEWAEKFGVSPSMLANRLESGWGFYEAVSTPSRHGDLGFYMTPIANRDAAWYAEYERREKEQVP